VRNPCPGVLGWVCLASLTILASATFSSGCVGKTPADVFERGSVQFLVDTTESFWGPPNGRGRELRGQQLKRTLEILAQLWSNLWPLGGDITVRTISGASVSQPALCPTAEIAPPRLIRQPSDSPSSKAPGFGIHELIEACLPLIAGLQERRDLARDSDIRNAVNMTVDALQPRSRSVRVLLIASDFRDTLTARVDLIPMTGVSVVMLSAPDEKESNSLVYLSRMREWEDEFQQKGAAKISRSLLSDVTSDVLAAALEQP